jgi:CheY-like chemotaxis protein
MSRTDCPSVLYVDDDPDICVVVHAALCLISGLEVHIAGSGLQAIAMVQELRPGIVLMDVMMPGLDGPSTLLRMHAIPSLAHIPVIFLTAKVLPSEIIRYREAGAIGVIGKPFDPLTLGDELFRLWNLADPAVGNHGAPTTAPLETQGREREEVQAQISGLADRFIERTRADVLRLTDAIARARGGKRKTLGEVQRVAHSIHGAGTMMGFPAISAWGAAIERLSSKMLVGSAGIEAARELVALQNLVDCVGQLAQEVEAGGRALSDQRSQSQSGGLGR